MLPLVRQIITDLPSPGSELEGECVCVCVGRAEVRVNQSVRWSWWQSFRPLEPQSVKASQYWASQNLPQVGLSASVRARNFLALHLVEGRHPFDVWCVSVKVGDDDLNPYS